jgi:hypothetical protein
VDDGVIKRVRDHVDAAGAEAALRRARDGMESVAEAAAGLEARLPATVAATVRAEAAPLARDVAELRGLAARTLRALERVEGDVAAERSARIEDLALLVDLVTAGWEATDARLARIEAALAAPLSLRAAS